MGEFISLGKSSNSICTKQHFTEMYWVYQYAYLYKIDVDRRVWRNDGILLVVRFFFQ